MAKTKIKKRTSVQIPEGTKIYDILVNGPHSGIKPKWRLLEDIANKLPKSNEEILFELFDDYVQKNEKIIPGCTDKFNKLRLLVFKKILKISILEDGLSDEYFESLKNL